MINDLPDQPYHILVTRADERPQGRVWSFGFAQTIPDAPLPLLAPNEHVPLPLQTAYATIYQARNFRNRLAYQDEPESPLTLEQKRTLQQLLVAAGLREG